VEHQTVESGWTNNRYYIPLITKSRNSTDMKKP
jgi:hypothetical protein